MVKLEAATHFLVLSDNLEKGISEVNCYSQFKDVLKYHPENSKVSPLFPLNDILVPDFDNKKSSLFFLGPIYPGKLDFPSTPNIYLTLGTFNVVVWCIDKNQVDDVISFIKTNNIPFEKWELSDNKVNSNIEHIFYKHSDKTPSSQKIIKTSKDIDVSAREYALLMNKGRFVARKYWPHQAEMLDKFSLGFELLMKNDVMKGNELGKLTSFVLSNAALSLYISQTFSGTTYIEKNECSYAPHSLLGIGLANQALLSIYSYITKKFFQFRLIDRIKLLKFVPPCSAPIFTLEAEDEIFNETPIFSKEINEELKSIKIGDAIPNICCFSGRDGFRSTDFSLSAPLETISSANTYAWSLMTLTHEISHLYIHAVLGVFLPKSDDRLIIRAKMLHKQSTKVNSLFERAEQLLLFGFQLIFHEQFGVTEVSKGSDEQTVEDIANEIPNFIKNCSSEVNEVLTHIFDFLYFYRREPELYVNSVWSSWAVIPNIETRIPEYIIRSICAIHSDDLSRDPSCAIDTFERYLISLESNLRSSFQTKNILQGAIFELENKRNLYKDAIIHRIPLIQFTRLFLFSETISAQLTGQFGAEPKDMSFRDEPIMNPLRFMTEHAKNTRSNMKKSVWILQNIAFSNTSGNFDE